MKNQNALTSTAMLASIWDKEKKDTLELILPFVTYSIGKTTSVGNQIEVASISEFISTNFGFFDIPHSVLYNSFRRLTKRIILIRRNHKFFLHSDLSEMLTRIDVQHNQAKTQTETVVSELTKYLNQKKERILKKDMTYEKVKECFVNFLQINGYFVYIEITRLREISANESTLYYHISQFILTEYDKKSDLFKYINNIVNGLLLSRVIYGYANFQYDEKFKNICIYLDTTLLLNIFGFKSKEGKTAASQLVEILCGNSVPIRCFKHNYAEVYKIIEAYKYNILDSKNRYGQTLEFFDEYEYSASDMDRVLSTLEEYFKENNIDIVDMPSFSSDGSGIISSSDYSSAIGENELKEHLSKKITYRNEEALNNDVHSISSIFTLRRGKTFKKIEQCIALFVTTNSQLAYATQNFINNTGSTVPLIINDLELTTLLWLKNHKRFSDLSTLKLIEVSRLSLEPTEQIRIEFSRKIEQLKSEPTMTDERASSYRQLIYTEKEKIMELISANPENIDKIQLNDLEQLSRQHYNSQLNNENQNLKRRLDDTKKKICIDSDEKINNSGKYISRILKGFIYTFLAIIFVVGIVGLFLQMKKNENNLFSIVLLCFSILGVVDAMFPRLHLINKLVTIIANKRKTQVRKKEQDRIQRILSDNK